MIIALQIYQIFFKLLQKKRKRCPLSTLLSKTSPSGAWGASPLRNIPLGGSTLYHICIGNTIGNECNGFNG